MKRNVNFFSLIIIAAVLLLSSCHYLTVNDVRTGNSAAYPDLQPLKTKQPYEEVFDTSVEVISSLDRWSLVEQDKEKGFIRAEVRTRTFRFVDDLTVTIDKGDPVEINVHSKARVGNGDFGKNARNIRLFLKEVEKRLE